jgi:hypothetical protein
MEVILMGDGERMAGMEEDMTQRHTPCECGSEIAFVLPMYPGVAVQCNDCGFRIGRVTFSENAIGREIDAAAWAAWDEYHARRFCEGINPEAVPEIVKALEDLFEDINNNPESLAIWAAGHPHIAAAHAALAKAREE